MAQRLDTWLVERNLAPSRTKAKALIVSGCVTVNGEVTTKSSRAVLASDEVHVDGESPLLRYVSRGGLKLEQALSVFDVDMRGARVLDIGSSTGGFTDCALQAGAACVYAVDVGTDCMDPVLAQDERVHLFEQTDIRNAPDECFQDIDYVVCDASFVSLLVILPVLSRIKNDFTALVLIKPQFEVGVRAAKRFKGVITSPDLHAETLDKVLDGLEACGLYAHALAPSPIAGGDGNREYLALLSREKPAKPLSEEDRLCVVRQAFSEIDTASPPR